MWPYLWNGVICSNSGSGTNWRHLKLTSQTFRKQITHNSVCNTSLQSPKTPLLLIKHFLKRYWTKIIENYILGEVNTTPTAPTRPTTLPCCSLLIKICFIKLLYNVFKKYWIVSIVLVVLWHNLNMPAALTRCMVEKNQSADQTLPPPTHSERRGQSSSLFFYSNLWLDVVLIRTTILQQVVLFI